MKKWFLLSLVLLCASLLLPLAVNAQSSDSSAGIAELAKCDERVKSSAAVTYGDSCIIAVKTENFQKKSDFLTYRKNVIKSVTEKYTDIANVYVTSNPKVFREIEKLSKLDETTKNQTIEALFERFKTDGNRPMPFDKPDHIRPMPKIDPFKQTGNI